MSKISNGGEYPVPTLLFPDGCVLTEPANAEGYSYAIPAMKSIPQIDVIYRKNISLLPFTNKENLEKSMKEWIKIS